MILPGARIVQMAWVVDKLETAAEQLSRAMQAGPFLVIRHIKLDDPHHRGRHHCRRVQPQSARKGRIS